MDTHLKEISLELRNYLKEQLRGLNSSDDFIDALPGSTFNRINPSQGSEEVIKSIKIILEQVG